MNINWKKTCAALISMLICVALVVAVVAVLALFGGAIMNLFGFQYDSVWSIILFFGIIVSLSFPLEPLVGAIPRVLLAFGKVPKTAAILMYIALDVLLSYVVFHFVDILMPSVAATDISILVLAFLMSLPGIKDVDKKPKGLR